MASKEFFLVRDCRNGEDEKCDLSKNGWLKIGRIFLVERTEVELFDRIAGIEWNAVEFYRNCCMVRSLRSLRQVATLRHSQMARRFAPAFKALGVCQHI